MVAAETDKAGAADRAAGHPEVIATTASDAGAAMDIVVLDADNAGAGLTAAASATRPINANN